MANTVSELLNEAGLVQAYSITRSRTYTLASTVYQAAGNKAEYTRQVGFSTLQNEQLVLNYIEQHGQIKRGEVMELCRLSENQASKLYQFPKVSLHIVSVGTRQCRVPTVAQLLRNGITY